METGLFGALSPPVSCEAMTSVYGSVELERIVRRTGKEPFAAYLAEASQEKGIPVRS